MYAGSCEQCYRKGGPGHYRLAEKRFKYRELFLNMPRKDHESFYEVTRLGTKLHDGAYMPQYSQERMSRQQVEDLRVYLEDAVVLGLWARGAVGQGVQPGVGAEIMRFVSVEHEAWYRRHVRGLG